VHLVAHIDMNTFFSRHETKEIEVSFNSHRCELR